MSTSSQTRPVVRRRMLFPLILVVLLLDVIVSQLGFSRLGGLENIGIRAEFVYLVIAAIAVAAIASELSVQGVIGLFSPFSGMMAGFLWFFCTVPLLKPEMDAFLYEDPAVYLLLAAIVLTGLIAFIAGYYLPVPMRRQKSPPALVDDYDRRLLKESNLLRLEAVLAIGLLGLLGIVAWLLGANPLRFLSESMYGSDTLPKQALAHPYARYFYQLQRFFLISLAGVCGLHLTLPKSSKLARLVPGLLFLLVGLLSAARGTRSLVFYSIGSGLVIILLRTLRSHRPRVAPALNWARTSIALLVFIMFGLVTLQLSVLRRTHDPIEAIRSFDVLDVLETRLFIDRGADMNRTLNFALQAVPERHPYFKGETYYSVLTLFVPGSVWPGKPDSLGSILAPLSGLSNSNISFSNLGELYVNFGRIGISLGMFLIGMALSCLWRIFLHYRDKAIVLLLYSLIPWAAAFSVRGDFTVVASGVLYPWLLTVGAIVMVPLSRYSPETEV